MIPVLCVALLVLGLLVVQLLRYEYVTENHLSLPLAIRIDRLTGHVCYIPFHEAAERYAKREVFLIQRCD